MVLSPPPDYTKAVLAIAIGISLTCLVFVYSRSTLPGVGDNLHSLPHGGYYRDGTKTILYGAPCKLNSLEQGYEIVRQPWAYVLLLTLAIIFFVAVCTLDNSVLLLILVVVVVGILLLTKPHDNCIIAITGESVRIINCGVSKELLELAREIKPAVIKDMPPKESPETSGSGAGQTPPTPPPRPPPERPEAPPPQTNQGEEQQILARLEALTNLLRKERSAVKVTNASFETGRPPLLPSEDMRGDVTNMYNKPSTDFLWSIKPKKVSNNMASSEDMVRIKVALEGLGVPTEHVTNIIMQLCVYCASTSSSGFQDPKGTFEWPGGAIMVDDVVGKVTEIAGLRRVCRLYAPVTWNYMHIHKNPPADWAAMGFTEETKYAAFDCFDYVQNGAAVQPLGGVVPKPSPAEHVAYQTYKQMALDKAGSERTYANLDASITGGRHGPEIVRNHNNANNGRQ